jgi:hypothetical protein
MTGHLKMKCYPQGEVPAVKLGLLPETDAGKG